MSKDGWPADDSERMWRKRGELKENKRATLHESEREGERERHIDTYTDTGSSSKSNTVLFFH